MITGGSGVGKSELGLELITRGSGLVADDIVELHHIAPDTLEGCCPELLRDFLEVRGLGVLNIRTMNIPVVAGRNLAVLIEAAARNFVLHQRGINSMDQFIARHDQLLLDE